MEKNVSPQNKKLKQTANHDIILKATIEIHLFDEFGVRAHDRRTSPERA